MGCFPACFGHLRRSITTEKVQHQCLPLSNEQRESMKPLPDKTESLKEVIFSESECNHKEEMDIHIGNEEKPVFNDSNLKKDQENEEKEENGDGKVQNGQLEILINEKESISECMEEECCSSLFSLSIDSRKQVFGAEMGEKEVSSSIPKIIKNNNSASLSKYDEEKKENVPSSKDPMMIEREQTFDKSKPMETSLSSWLVVSQNSPQKMNGGISSPESENNYGDRQVLGVISTADVIKLNGLSSLGLTPCCSCDDQAGVGTVGRYWRRRGGARDSCREV